LRCRATNRFTIIVAAAFTGHRQLHFFETESPAPPLYPRFSSHDFSCGILGVTAFPVTRILYSII
jgi:hypothetical protein